MLSIPDHETGAASAAPVFNTIDMTECQSATPQAVLDENYRRCRQRGLVDIFETDTVGKSKPDRLALVGGGPSMADYLDAIMAHKAIMACGSAHKFFSDRGLPIQYAVNCDGDVHQTWHFMQPIQRCTYLLATVSPPNMFDALRGSLIWTWNSQGTVTGWPDKTGGKWIGGGATVTTRAMNVALMLGYTGIDVYGFDCSFRGHEQHAYETQELERYKVTTLARCEEGGKVFETSPGLYAEAQCFREMLKQYGGLFADMVIHGDGLVPEMLKVAKRKMEMAA